MSQLTQLDANQVTKTVYDPNTQALKTVPTYVDTTTLASQSAAVSFTSSPVNILAYKVTGMMISWTGLNTADASIQFQGSIDGVTYENVGSAVVLSVGSGQKGVSFIDEPYKFIQAVYSHGTNSAGTVTIKYIQRA